MEMQSVAPFMGHSVEIATKHYSRLDREKNCLEAEVKINRFLNPPVLPCQQPPRLPSRVIPLRGLQFRLLIINHQIAIQTAHGKESQSSIDSVSGINPTNSPLQASNEGETREITSIKKFIHMKSKSTIGKKDLFLEEDTLCLIRRFQMMVSGKTIYF